LGVVMGQFPLFYASQISLLFKRVQISYFGHWLILYGSMPLNLGQLG